MQTNWVGSKEEQMYFDEYLELTDRIKYAKKIVKEGHRDLPEYWTQMAVLCERKAQLLRKPK